MNLDIPRDGLEEVLGAWSGQGRLWEALAAVEDPLAERRWTGSDIRRRAHRILFHELLPVLARLPERHEAWIDALPAEIVRVRRISESPTPYTRWSETRRQFGWPPAAFVERPRSRVADTLLVTTLKWVLSKLAFVRKDAVSVAAKIDDSVLPQLRAALNLLEHEPLQSAEPVAPTVSDLRTMRYEGSPWNIVADIATELLLLNDTKLGELASRLIEPEADLRWRLFHLAILGKVLIAARNAGATVVSKRPLSGGASGPAYEVIDVWGRCWDLWFEAAGMWSHYRLPSPYRTASAGLGSGSRPVGADLVLIRKESATLIIECKFSPNPSVVGSAGYEQAVAYAAEVRSQLALPGTQVVAIAVGPASVVSSANYVDLVVGRVGIVPPPSVGEWVQEYLSMAPEIAITSAAQ